MVDFTCTSAIMAGHRLGFVGSTPLRDRPNVLRLLAADLRTQTGVRR